MNTCFAYIRVSTAKQGSQGVSLQEQRSAIEAYAARNAIDIVEWFEEQETAAKRGRPVFSRMLKRLEATEAAGVIIHKIDRGARNLRDWADLGDLIDKGVKVHFAVESLDLETRGGRLSADIQAVVAADYIRNLREETRKGFYGRLKQGFYPLAAPLGYLDNGKAKPKTICPVKGPLVKHAFELYATGTHTLPSLRKELRSIGLTNKGDKPISMNGLSRILNNPFYVGIIRLRNGQTYPGIHEPLVSQALFNAVGSILHGRMPKMKFKHDFRFRQRVTCRNCRRKAIGETKKGHVYYRCHECRGSSVREETIDAAVRGALATIVLSRDDAEALELDCAAMIEDRVRLEADMKRTFAARLDQAKGRLERLTDAMVDGLISRQGFDERRAALQSAIAEIEQQRLDHERDPARGLRTVMEYLGRAQTALLQYEIGTQPEKREVLRILTSDIFLDRKNVVVELFKPCRVIAEARNLDLCGPTRGTARTALMDRLAGSISADEDPGREKPNEVGMEKDAENLRFAA